MLFEKKNAPILIRNINIINGNMILCNEMPDDFNAVSSRFSPIFPNVIRAANNMANGKAIGMKLIAK